LRFGPGGAQAIDVLSIADYGGSPVVDMAVSFATDDASFQCDQANQPLLVLIEGQTTTGLQFEGMQKVLVNSDGCEDASCHP
jgi:hypothetical protein